ncbi:MAG: 3-keto-5-aminohexanoate cleavage protein [Lachnospiraceae bacterium]|nr:3-keto-5-aminohexanoate cleavage protein [Lachnospiraceae bacterium]
MAKQKKVIVTCAVTGAIHTPTMNENLPRGVMGVSQAAIDAANAGASMVHIHCRDDNGKPTSSLEVWGETLSRVKANTDAIIGVTTGGAIGMSVEERVAVIPMYQPEVASFNGGSMNFNLEGLAPGIEGKEMYDWETPFLKGTAKNVFQNTFDDMRKILTIMNEAGTVPEFEIFDFGQLYNINYLYKSGFIKEPLYFQFVPGILGGIPATPENIMYFQEHVDKLFGDKANFSMVASGRRNFRFSTLNVLLGGNVRVGMEDSLYITPGEMTTSNARQVEKIIRILHELDYEVASPDEARAILHTKGKDKVKF